MATYQIKTYKPTGKRYAMPQSVIDAGEQAMEDFVAQNPSIDEAKAQSESYKSGAPTEDRTEYMGTKSGADLGDAVSIGLPFASYAAKKGMSPVSVGAIGTLDAASWVVPQVAAAKVAAPIALRVASPVARTIGRWGAEGLAALAGTGAGALATDQDVTGSDAAMTLAAPVVGAGLGKVASGIGEFAGTMPERTKAVFGRFGFGNIDAGESLARWSKADPQKKAAIQAAATPTAANDLGQEMADALQRKQLPEEIAVYDALGKAEQQFETAVASGKKGMASKYGVNLGDAITELESAKVMPRKGYALTREDMATNALLDEQIGRLEKSAISEGRGGFVNPRAAYDNRKALDVAVNWDDPAQVGNKATYEKAVKKARGALARQLESVVPDYKTNIEPWSAKIQAVSELRQKLGNGHEESFVNNIFGRNKTEAQAAIKQFDDLYGTNFLDRAQDVRDAYVLGMNPKTGQLGGFRKSGDLDIKSEIMFSPRNMAAAFPVAEGIAKVGEPLFSGLGQAARRGFAPASTQAVRIGSLYNEER